jgi:transmembrane sensor
MYENAEYIRDLIVKHIREEITPAEKDQLQQWIDASGSNRQLFDELTTLPSLYEKLNACDRYVAEKDVVWEKIEKKPGGRLAFIKSGWVKYAAAAVILLIAGYWLLTTRDSKSIKPEVTQQQPQKEDIEPGQYKALLTLDNGQTIVLDSAVQGQLTKQGNTVVLNKDGQLVYDASKATRTEVAYNTLTTAKGQTYATVLADGSKVWLNAGSSIRYPVVFVGNERRVEVTGEAYFEIKRDQSKPFKVIIKSGSNQGEHEIKVLGTHFNVNAYEEEPEIKTTLLEGSIKFTTKNKNLNTISEVLIPAQYAVVKKLTNDLIVNTAQEPESDIAWVNGKFSFEKTNLKAVMRELSRWYDVQIIFEGEPDAHTLFTGKVERMIPLSRLLSNLEMIGDVKFAISGRTVKVKIQS